MNLDFISSESRQESLNLLLKIIQHKESLPQDKVLTHEITCLRKIFDVFSEVSLSMDETFFIERYEKLALEEENLLEKKKSFSQLKLDYSEQVISQKIIALQLEERIQDLSLELKRVSSHLSLLNVQNQEDIKKLSDFSFLD